MADLISHSRLLELLSYDAETGEFVWKVSRKGPVWAGASPGAIDKDGYLMICVNRRHYRAHRLAWFYVTKKWPLHQIDHIDGVKTNNRFANLRDVPGRVNSQNIHKSPRKSHSSVYLGVSFSADRHRTKPWLAQIVVAGKNHFLGRFETEEDAHSAYVSAKRRLHEGCTI